MLNAGDKAPDFTLSDKDGNIALKDLYDLYLNL